MYIHTFRVVTGEFDPDMNSVDTIGDNFLICEESSTLTESCEASNPKLTASQIVERLQSVQPSVLIAAAFHAAKNYKCEGYSTPGCGDWECIIPGPETGKIEEIDIQRSYVLHIEKPTENTLRDYNRRGFNVNTLPIIDEADPSNAKVILNTTHNDQMPMMMWRFRATVNNVQQVFIGCFRFHDYAAK